MCPLCKKDGSESTITLRNHFTKHDRKAIVEAQELYVKNHTKENPSSFLYHCDKCGKGFNNLFFLQEHKSVHFLELFCCSHCPKTFGAYYGIVSHFKKCHIFETDVRITCRSCKSQFANTFQYKKHMRDQHNVIKAKLVFECSHCNFVGVRNIDFIKHLFLHVKRKDFRCCSQVFKNRQELDKHKSLHKQSVEKNKKCNLCKQTILKTNFLQHVIWHKIQDHGSVNCSDCDKKFTDAKVYLEHKKTRNDCQKTPLVDQHTQPTNSIGTVKQTTNEKPQEAERTGRSNTRVSPIAQTTKAAKLTEEVKKSIPEVSSKVSSNVSAKSGSENLEKTKKPIKSKSITTGSVGKTTPDQVKVGKQTKSRITSSNLCKFCDKYIETGFVRHLVEHKLKDHGFVKCTNCDKSFTEINIYLEHKKSRTDCTKILQGDKTSQKNPIPESSQIPETTQILPDLGNSIVLEEKKHVCKYCSKKFKTEEGLSTHIKLSCNTKIFMCLACFVKFETNQELQSHLVTKSIEPTPANKRSKRRLLRLNKSCSMCSKKVTGISGLHKHILEEPDCHLKTGAKKIFCTPCNRLFKSNISLKNHNSFHHQGENPSEVAPAQGLGESRGLAKKAFHIKRGLHLNCNWCEQFFTSTQALKAHSVIHTNFRRNVNQPGTIPQQYFVPGPEKTSYRANEVVQNEFTPLQESHPSGEPFLSQEEAREEPATNVDMGDFYHRDAPYKQPGSRPSEVHNDPEESIAFRVARKRDKEMVHKTSIKTRAYQSPTRTYPQNRQEARPTRAFATHMEVEPLRRSFSNDRDRESPPRSFPNIERESLGRSQSRGIGRGSPRRSLSLSRDRDMESPGRQFSTRHDGSKSPRELFSRDAYRAIPLGSLSRNIDRISHKRSYSGIRDRESPRGSFSGSVHRISSQRSLSRTRDRESPRGSFSGSVHRISPQRSLSRNRDKEISQRTFPGTDEMSQRPFTRKHDEMPQRAFPRRDEDISQRIFTREDESTFQRDYLRKDEEPSRKSFHESRDRERRRHRDRHVGKSHERTDYASRQEDPPLAHSTNAPRDIVTPRRGDIIRRPRSRSNSPYSYNRAKRQRDYRSKSSERDAPPRQTQYRESELPVMYHQERHKCRECGEEFGSQQSLAYHTDFHLLRAKLADPSPAPPVNPGNVYRDQPKERTQTPKCNECGAEFLSEQSLLYHMKSHAVSPRRVDVSKVKLRNQAQERNELGEYSQPPVYYNRENVRRQPAAENIPRGNASFVEDFPPIQRADGLNYDGVPTKADQLMNYSHPVPSSSLVPSKPERQPIQPQISDQSRYKNPKGYELSQPRDSSYYFFDSDHSEKNKRQEGRYFSQKSTQKPTIPSAPPAPQISNTDRSKPFTSLCLETINKGKQSESKPFYEISLSAQTSYPNLDYYSKSSSFNRSDLVSLPRQDSGSSFASNRVQCPGCGESIPKPLMLFHRCAGR